MTAYKDRILNVIGEERMGLTTVDVAKKAGVSKTTVIKYLSVMSSEGLVEFVEVGPSKLWRKKNTSMKLDAEKPTQNHADEESFVEMILDVGDTNCLTFSFRADSKKVCEILKRSGKCQLYDAYLAKRGLKG